MLPPSHRPIKPGCQRTGSVSIQGPFCWEVEPHRKQTMHQEKVTMCPTLFQIIATAQANPAGSQQDRDQGSDILPAVVPSLA